MEALRGLSRDGQWERWGGTERTGLQEVCTQPGRLCEPGAAACSGVPPRSP